MAWSRRVKLNRGRWTMDDGRLTISPELAKDERLERHPLSSVAHRLSSFIHRPSSIVHRPSIWSVPVGLQLSVIYAVLLSVTLALLGTSLYIWLNGFLVQN